MAYKTNLYATFSESVKRDKTGNVKSSKVKVDWKADDLFINLDERAISAAMIKAAAEGIREDFKSMPSAKPATLERRERRLRAWTNGNISATDLKRFNGGQTGLTPPKASTKLFNESGRLANGLAFRARKNSKGESVITLNVPANRFTTKSFGSSGQLEANVFAQLKQHHPWFKSGGLRGQTNDKLNAALNKAQDQTLSFTKQEALRVGKLTAKAAFDIARVLSAFAKGI